MNSRDQNIAAILKRSRETSVKITPELMDELTKGVRKAILEKAAKLGIKPDDLPKEARDFLPISNLHPPSNG